MRNVRHWPKADMSCCAAHVRFRRNSGHDRLRESAFAVALGSKADMLCCTAYVSAYDPKRTCTFFACVYSEINKRAFPQPFSCYQVVSS